MAERGNTNPTLLDITTRGDGKGSIASDIVELLNETNEVLDDATFLQCNDGSQNKTTIRTGLPQATWRMLNYGVQPSKSTTVQVKDATGMLESYAEVDKKLLEMSGDPAGFRKSEDAAFLEGMSQTFVETLFYGNSAINPERFMGLGSRFNQIAGAESGQNIIDAGGTGSDNQSIWLVVWGPRTVFCTYPAGSKAGFDMKDLGEVTKVMPDGSMFQVMRSHYKWDAGLVVRDWRYVVRIANIDNSDLTKNNATGADLTDLMVQALELVPNLSAGRPVFYANRTVTSFLRRQMLNKGNLLLNMSELGGKKVMSFGEVPVRRVEELLKTEARVV